MLNKCIILHNVVSMRNRGWGFFRIERNISRIMSHTINSDIQRYNYLFLTIIDKIDHLIMLFQSDILSYRRENFPVIQRQTFIFTRYSRGHKSYIRDTSLMSYFIG